jgi:Icc-related predicted phosphoesterase
MDILVVGDCHGEKPDLGEEATEADLIIVTGDVCGDSEKIRNAMFRSVEEEKDWWDIIGREEAKKAVTKSLQEGRDVFEYLDSFEKPVFVVPGNWDWIGDETWAFLAENRFQNMIEDFKNIHNIDREVFTDGNFSYIGYGPCSAPEIPQYEDDKPDSEEEMESIEDKYMETKEELERLFEEAESPVIFLSHNVPHGTSLDRVENPDSPADGRHYGSIVVKELIEKFEPVLSVAGHIHEGKGTGKIEDVICLNAGLHSHVMVEIDGAEVKNIDLY